MQREALAVIGAAPDAVGRGHQQSRVRAGAEGEAMHILVELLVAHLAMRPGLAVVARAIDSIDLDTDPDRLLITRIDDDVGDLGRAREASLGHRNLELLPGLAPITRTIDRRMLGAEEHRVGFAGMKRDRPDLPIAGRRL